LYVSDEGDGGASLVHLPHIQLLVLFDALVDLIVGESLAGAPLHNVRHADGPALVAQLTNQVVDPVNSSSRPVHTKCPLEGQNSPPQTSDTRSAPQPSTLLLGTGKNISSIFLFTI